MRRSLASLVALLLIGAPFSPLDAQSSSSASKPCAQAESRQFDFWIGDWDVHSPDGKAQGTNSITSELGGCVLHERWRGVGGMTGESFNHYAPGARRWYQTWVDDQGGFLLFSGAFENGKLTMTGATPTVKGDTVLHRLSFERLGDSTDRVRQFWQTSSDGGKTWTVAFEGIYVRRKQR